MTVALCVVVAILLVLHVVTIFTDAINWDEFVLLSRADATLRTGELMGGGRPGLGTLLLIPFAAGCRNAVHTLVQARLLWTAIVAASVLALWFLLHAVLPTSPYRRIAIATGVGLWVLAAPVVRSSLQVRTDQPAILFGLLGGLGLVASRRRIWWAAVAGALMGVGFLFSQKLLYVAALMGVLAFGQLLILGEWQTRRDLIRSALTAAAFLSVVIGYVQLMQVVAGPPALLPVSEALDYFDYYREFYGWSLYGQMLPSLLPQMLTVALLAAGTAGWIGERRRDGKELSVAWLVTLAGLVVLFFHAGRFPYFYMVLGLFVAVVGALALGPVLERLELPTARRALIVVLWVPLTVMGLTKAWALTTDTQRIQRESLAFVERNFPSDARGFQTHGALVCRNDPDDFPTRLRGRVLAEFGGVGGAEHVGELMNEFRSRPVSFLVPPFESYPHELRRFWDTRYVKYFAAVHVPGRWIRGPRGATGTFEVIVPGEYIWRTSTNDSAQLEVQGRILKTGSSIALPAQGEYPISLPEGGEGMIVLALPQPPSPNSRGFYAGW